MEISLKRALLEVMKYLTVPELLTASSISHFWFSMCQDDEIWLQLLGEDGSQDRLAMIPIPSPKEAYRQLMRNFVLVIRENRLLRYSLSTEKWSSKALSISWQISPMIAITYLSEKRQLFCCGGEDASADTLMIDTHTGTGSKLQPMRLHRPYPGLCRYRRHVYCFGGDIVNKVKKCDKFSISASSWESLPDCIEIRHAFNPVLHADLIYLPNGCCPTIEVFNPQTEVFSMLSFNTSMHNSSANVMFEGKLVIIGLFQTFVCDLHTKESRVVPHTITIDSAWSTFDLVTYRNQVAMVWPYQDYWKMAVVDLKTYKIRVEVIPMA